MEHVYTAYTKLVQGKTHYFVKKIMVIPELIGLADIVVGFGMHSDFEKACSIAGIDDIDCRNQLLKELEESNQPAKPVEQVKEKVHIPEAVTGEVTHWLADRAVAVLN